jgi:transposase
LETYLPNTPDVHLSDHDLRQLDDAALANLTPEQARSLLSKAIEDLKNARERLAQNPTNSSRPPSTRAPWEQAEAQGREPEEGSAGAGQGAESGCSESESESESEVGAEEAGEVVQRQGDGEASRTGGPTPRCTGAQPHPTAAGRCRAGASTTELRHLWWCVGRFAPQPSA